MACAAAWATAQDNAASAPVLAPVEIAVPVPVVPASAAARASAPLPTPATPTAPAVLSLGQNWSSLTPMQKEALAPLSREWDQLDGAHKGKWLEIAARYPTLPVEHQQRLRERMVEWTRMSAADRQKARIGYQHAGELRGPEQTKLQAKWEAYQALSPEKRQRLVERAAEKASAERRDAPPAPNLAKAPIQRAPLSVTSTGPTVVQARPGATTVLLTQRAEPAPAGASTAPGRPLRTPREARLDPNTLLPKRDGASR
ncbi:hypothetical protein CDN99_02375 [Roseateles aquatilis]|uniref:DUF3106 domain-containing protein n=1 Tax=Roseateles aquatilis TaxID=431061 RepID=A0A246JL61_9BURK|nr:hypothetical protein CDN99_02375 [Roseateles aquatilis]